MAVATSSAEAPTSPAPEGFRAEQDSLGEYQIPAEALHGIHTARALVNFPLTLRPVHPELVRAYGVVKLACVQINRQLGYLSSEKASALEKACQEMVAGLLTEHIVVDALQGGAGTSTNMNVNEVLANRALVLMGERPGTYGIISPLDDVNRHQSTNDTYPTALRIAAIWLLRPLESAVLELQEEFQGKEREFSRIVKVGRTEMQDAVLTTLGRSMGAFAEAFGRDRWRISRCEERLRVINLGGTAIGTGVTAPREFIFSVTDRLRELTGLGLARAENLLEATQNADAFVEVSGILKACAASLLKVSSDLRLLSSGPEAGLGELTLPPRQAGSSIMPGKVNPVIPEAVSQAAFTVFANDQSVTLAASAGSLELNPFLPLIAEALLSSLDLLARSCKMLALLCVKGLRANENRCRQHVESSTATATSLLPALGYEGAKALLSASAQSNRSIKETAVSQGLLSESEFDTLTSPEAVCRLGSPNAWRRQ